jgi:hypothetical protein
MVQYGGNTRDEAIGPVYHASYRMQRGGGVGQFLGGLFRFVRPLFIRGAQMIGKEAVHTGANILSDIVLKKPEEKMGPIIKNRITEAVERKMKGGGSGLNCFKTVAKRKRSHSASNRPGVNPPKKKTKKKKIKKTTNTRDIFE